jgi:hypothetical protein
MRDGWLKEPDLIGLGADKIAQIKDGAETFRRIYSDTDDALDKS